MKDILLGLKDNIVIEEFRRLRPTGCSKPDKKVNLKQFRTGEELKENRGKIQIHTFQE